MKYKKEITIIAGVMAIAACAGIVWMYINTPKEISSWKIYKNSELNFETKLPEGVEVEVVK